MRFIKHSVGSIKDNIFGTTPDPKKEVKNDVRDIRAPVNGYSRQVPNAQTYRTPGMVAKSDTLNEVSPIQYSQRSFSRAPADRFSFFWIYGLIAIGFFLVLFQSLK